VRMCVSVCLCVVILCVCECAYFREHVCVHAFLCALFLQMCVRVFLLMLLFVCSVRACVECIAIHR
jgi:hypothetical protein